MGGLRFVDDSVSLYVLVSSSSHLISMELTPVSLAAVLVTYYARTFLSPSPVLSSTHVRSPVSSSVSLSLFPGSVLASPLIVTCNYEASQSPSRSTAAIPADKSGPMAGAFRPNRPRCLPRSRGEEGSERVRCQASTAATTGTALTSTLRSLAQPSSSANPAPA